MSDKYVTWKLIISLLLAFNEWIHDRETKLPSDPSIILFDQIILAKKNRGRTGFFSKSSKWLRASLIPNASSASSTNPGLCQNPTFFIIGAIISGARRPRIPLVAASRATIAKSQAEVRSHLRMLIPCYWKSHVLT
jgi:hypothetical protein